MWDRTTRLRCDLAEVTNGRRVEKLCDPLPCVEERDMAFVRCLNAINYKHEVRYHKKVVCGT